MLFATVAAAPGASGCYIMESSRKLAADLKCRLDTLPLVAAKKSSRSPLPLAAALPPNSSEGAICLPPCYRCGREELLRRIAGHVVRRNVAATSDFRSYCGDAVECCLEFCCSTTFSLPKLREVAVALLWSLPRKEVAVGGPSPLLPRR